MLLSTMDQSSRQRVIQSSNRIRSETLVRHRQRNVTKHYSCEAVPPSLMRRDRCVQCCETLMSSAVGVGRGHHMPSTEAIAAAASAAAEGSGPAVAELRRLLESGPVDWSQDASSGKGALNRTIKGGGKGKRSFGGKGQGTGDSESNVEAVKLLLEHNADPNEAMEGGGEGDVTMSMMAIIMGQEGALEALLEAKADIEAKVMPSNWGGPLLQLAAGGLGSASPEMTKILLQHKADIHAIDDGGGKGKAGGMDGKGTARPKTAGKHGGNGYTALDHALAWQEYLRQNPGDGCWEANKDDELESYNEVVQMIQDAMEAELQGDLGRVEEEVTNWRKSEWV